MADTNCMTATPTTDTDTDTAAEDAALAEWNASASLVTYCPNYRDVIRDTRRATMRPGSRPE
jgi:hypothetical protein